MRPRVLIAGPESSAEYLEPYALAIRRAGGEPVCGWPAPEVVANGSALEAFMSTYQGLLLPGGADVSPERYGEPPHEMLGNTDPELDEVQLALAALALRSSFPTLAICRGIQVIAVAAGVGLYQDLPSQCPSLVRHRIRTPKDALAHEVELHPKSRLASLSGSSRFPVNSRHHQAARPGDQSGWIGPLRIVAHAPDGIVEGAEHPEHRFLVAVQWHPENLIWSRPEASRLFHGFVAACSEEVG